jgi:pimeloyl-ACP methyl ester carboxylesterase
MTTRLRHDRPDHRSSRSSTAGIAFRVAVDDTVLTVTENGDGPPVVFLNGDFGTTRDWRAVRRRLPNVYRVVSFDGRGRGESRPSRRYSLQASLADFAAVLAEVGLCRPILVGWSSGCRPCPALYRGAPRRGGRPSARRPLVSGLAAQRGGQTTRPERLPGGGPAMRVLAALGRSAKDGTRRGRRSRVRTRRISIPATPRSVDIARS